MRYERRKEFTALLSIASVTIAFVAVAYQTDSMSAFSTGIAAAIAGVAAVLSILMSHRLAEAREEKRVFLIYAREDLEIARKLAVDLREGGFAPWLDVDEIKPGQVWKKRVVRALEESSVALVLVSPHLDKNGFVREELKVALDTLQEREKDVSPVIPVRLDPTAPVPERLAHVQWVNLFEESGLPQLMEGLKHVSAAST